MLSGDGVKTKNSLLGNDNILSISYSPLLILLGNFLTRH